MRVGHVLVIRRWPLARPPRKTPRAISAHRRKRIESIQKNAQGGEHRRKRKKDIEKCRGRRAPTNDQIVAGKTPRAHGGAQRTRGARARARALELGRARCAPRPTRKTPRAMDAPTKTPRIYKDKRRERRAQTKTQSIYRKMYRAEGADQNRD